MNQNLVTNQILSPIIFSLFDLNSSQLPARSTRLLNRSRFQQDTISNHCSEGPLTFDTVGNRKATSRSSSQFGGTSANCSPDDHLFMVDKSLRNSMIQDVYYCKQQLLALRSLLQDVSIISISFSQHLIYTECFFATFLSRFKEIS